MFGGCFAGPEKSLILDLYLENFGFVSDLVWGWEGLNYFAPLGGGSFGRGRGGASLRVNETWKSDRGIWEVFDLVILATYVSKSNLGGSGLGGPDGKIEK